MHPPAPCQPPPPSTEELRHSQRLAQRIHEEIAATGGWISFARYMELALYAPGLGYYSAGTRKFGAAGDFVTAPETSSLFGAVLARQVAAGLHDSGGDLLEIGGGSGKLAVDLLHALAQLSALPRHYYLLEVSADLRQRQQALIDTLDSRLATKVQWLDTLPTRFTGVVIGNEVLDAMPVHLVHWRQDGVFERGVAADDDTFHWQERPATDGPLKTAADRLDPGAGYLSEIPLAASAFTASLGRLLERGLILLIDYGFGGAEYYHPQRRHGTLMCHYRHHSHDDPFYLPGLQDITAHVDFSAITAAALVGGLQLLGYTTQANFLVNCGLTDQLGRVSPEDPAYPALASQAQRLLSPAEMGELFKVIAFGKGMCPPLPGFAAGDKSRLL